MNPYLKKIGKFLFITPVLFAGLLTQSCTGSNLTSEHDPPSVKVAASAEVLVPADVINFRINIGTSASTTDQAYSEHQRQESFLAGLLQELQVEEKNITYQPMSIRPNRQRDGSIHSTTSQGVTVKIEDFNLFTVVQKKLIDNGFDNFSANFYSTEFENGGNDALAKAVRIAREDAEIIAEAAGGRIGKVLSISHGQLDVQPVLRTEFSAAMLADSPSLMDFSQTIPVKRNVVVVFELLD